MGTGFNGPERRRSLRLVWDVGLVIRGDSPKFEEDTFTISVSGHGALVLLENEVKVGQELFLLNPLTGNEISGKVVRIGAPHSGKCMVGIDFDEPSDEFWPFGKNA